MTTRLLLGITAAAVALAAGAAVWADRPMPLEVRCPDGSEPEAAAISAVLGRPGHEGEGATLLLEGGRARLQAAGGPARDIGPTERAGLLARLRHPRPVDPELVGTGAQVLVSRRCGGVELESRHAAGHGTAALQAWLDEPLKPDRVVAAVAGTVAGLDPHTRRVVALSVELLTEAYPGTRSANVLAY